MAIETGWRPTECQREGHFADHNTFIIDVRLERQAHFGFIAGQGYFC